MNFDHAIRELEEKRAFYAAAIAALRKLAHAEQGWPTQRGKVRKKATTRPGWTPARRAKMTAVIAARKAKANGADPSETPRPAPDRPDKTIA